MGLRHAKIVCTLGPATDSVQAISALVDAGMDVARLNFSHGTHDEHARRAATVRAQAQLRGKPLAVLQDLSGPKIRTGRGGPPTLSEGETIALVEGTQGSDDAIAIGYAGLASDLHAGDVVRLDDGRIVAAGRAHRRVTACSRPSCRRARRAIAWG